MHTAVVFLVQYPVALGILGAVLFAAIRWMLVAADRRRCEWFLVASCLAVPAAGSCEAITKWMSHLRPLKLDQFIYRIDGLLGFQMSFVLGRVALRHLWLEIIANMAYNLLPCAILALWAAYLWCASAPDSLRVLRAFALNLFLAVPIYLLIPVCGPAFSFPSFPYAAPAHFVPHWIPIDAPPNGIPSVHTSTALLILYFARRWRIGTWLASGYLVLILFATMASGQHFFFDLVTGVPYTFLVLYLTRSAWIRATHAHLSTPSALKTD